MYMYVCMYIYIYICVYMYTRIAIRVLCWGKFVYLESLAQTAAPPNASAAPSSRACPGSGSSFPSALACCYVYSHY